MHLPLEAMPSVSALFLDYIQGSDRARQFFSYDHSLDAVAAFARESAPTIDATRRDSLTAALEAGHRRWGLDIDSIERLRSGAVAVVTGQQAGLFTGPMYSILKALTAVKLARALVERGVEAVPVFWIAAEDHDHEEIEWAGILSEDSTLGRVTTQLGDGAPTPVGWLRFGSSIQEAIDECFSFLPPSEHQDEVRTLVEDAYCPDASPVDAYARMMARLFKDSGLILVDPLDSGLRELAKDVLGTLASQVAAVRSALLARGRKIAEAGYAEQVRVDKSFTGLFAYRGRAREPLGPGDEMASLSLSPNVLLRPLVQDSLFPTTAYVGGPAEIAYMAQAGSVYECIGKPMPPIFPRITATLVEPPVARVMKKYDFSIADVFQGMDSLRMSAVSSGSGAEVFRDARQRMSDEMARLRPVLEGVDPTLGGALDNAVQKIMHQVDTLHARFVKGESRRDAVLERHLKTLTTRLFPDEKVQERVVNVTTFLGRYGLNLVPMMDRALELDGSVHQVVEL